MDTENRKQLLEELRQVCDQYRNEVPGDRRTWPQSAKKRIRKLRELNVPWKVIAANSGIPLTTLYSWRVRKSKPPSSGNFVPVKLTPESQSVTPSSPLSRSNSHNCRHSHSSSISIQTPSGYRLEGLDIETALQIIEKWEGRA